MDEGERQAKGILPVVLRETDDVAIPGRLARLNFIFMRTPEERAAQFERVVGALSTDLHWAREKYEMALGDGNASPCLVVFGPGDGTIISTLEDNILIHDVESYTLASQLTVPAASVSRAGASAGGSYIVAELSSDGMPIDQMFALPYFETPEARIRAARMQAPRCLTPEERRAIFVSEAQPRWCITGPGHEAETDPAGWHPLHPYRGPAWRDWQIARDRGLSPSLPE